MANWNDDLTAKPLEIAENKSNRLRVMAGPGTGKSFAMKRRIMRLIQKDNVEPESILAVTFTRTAAGDLKKELKELGIPGGENIRAMTLHSFCFGLLNEKEVFEKLRRHPRPLKSFTKRGSPQFELSPALADLDLVGNFGGKAEKFEKLKAFEAGWARQQSENLWITNADDRKFKDAIESWLREHNAMLIGELVPLALKYLQGNPTSDVLRRFEHIVVDEYQDLNKAEQTLIDLLGGNCEISIVGDVDQSIYSFRCAHPEGIIDFEARHVSGVKDVALDECRRCGKAIVQAADTLIRENHSDKTKSRLSPFNGNGAGKVISVQWSSSDDEARGIADGVKTLLDSGLTAGDILILCPRRLLGYHIRDLIQGIGISVHSFYHEEALEEEDAQKAIATLNLFVDRNDSVSLRFYLGIGSNTWRSSQYRILTEEARRSGKTVFEILENAISGINSIKGVAAIKKSFETLKSTLALLEGKSVSEVVDCLFPEGQETTKSLREIALLVLKKNPETTVEDIWDHFETVLTQPEMPEAGNFVRVMSLHKSKGLTAKVTIVASCIQGLIPTLSDGLSSEEEKYKLEEQRRLFYVAMTRAKDLLLLSSFTFVPTKLAYKIGAEFTHKGAYAETMASQFLTELAGKIPSTITGDEWRRREFVT